jgi:hypothetical protein
MKNQLSLLALCFALLWSCAEEEPEVQTPVTNKDVVDSYQAQTQKDFSFIGGTIPEYDQDVIAGGQLNSDMSAGQPAGQSAGQSAGQPAGQAIQDMNLPQDMQMPNHESCQLSYDFPETNMKSTSILDARYRDSFDTSPDAHFDWQAPSIPIAHPQLEEGTWTLILPNMHQKTNQLVMPGGSDNMPVFERALDWQGANRCYVLPSGGQLLSEREAYDLYKQIVKETLRLEINESPNHRTVVGIRGAYPGTFEWHGNTPNYFNDTIVLLWKDENQQPHVKEYPVNTDTGAFDFGAESSSSLRPNRHYPYVNGWHRDYNALRINIDAYPVRDDTNNNGHWDSDRNGWLSGGDQDYDRNGGAHNIHAGVVDAPLSGARVNRMSAGCQVIPGTSNWLSFITNAWTGLNDPVDYYLIDARDIAPTVFNPCVSEDGTHACPIHVNFYQSSYQHHGDTSQSTEKQYDEYNCSTANESGAEIVYIINTTRLGRLNIDVTVADDRVDPDIYLLEGDDQMACRARDHESVSEVLPAGRYVLIIDTWTDANGNELAGEYDLNITFNPR